MGNDARCAEEDTLEVLLIQVFSNKIINWDAMGAHRNRVHGADPRVLISDEAIDSTKHAVALFGPAIEDHLE